MLLTTHVSFGNRLGKAVNIGEIYLAAHCCWTLTRLGAISDTAITFQPMSSPAIRNSRACQSRCQLTPLFSDNGSRGGTVGIAPVPPDRLPSPLPPGLNFSLVITVQTDGPLADTPALGLLPTCLIQCSAAHFLRAASRS